ncbi:hypothetical protein EN817_17485 [Mesorhizobium sp. M3A.F.Ca.ET.174.01.1.1]|uniref:hypothetical protein n=1 Tax=unclassified Mesorhizobium TaxID=325217 RepID=UPI0010936B5E|nr:MULTISPECIES: hypothetical protein [unclassified Mesorhizobium]TGS86694.1 hypothetical protein EN818_15340 [Mesorhizobium sp. M3A.F.Ca.ET.175.01.1.1]TGT25142.1 hypothetical protein EN817_17485 [Mesorhizobium sp. M3A.F.Ca.ET.174.01.1.1]
MAQDIDIGDEVTLEITIVKLLEGGRASVRITGYDHPFSMAVPPKSKVGDKLELTREAVRVDDDLGTVTVSIGQPVTVRQSAVAASRPPPRKKPLRDKPT